MRMPLTSFPVDPKDSPNSLNQRKIQRIGYFTQKDLSENILTDIKAQGNRLVSPFNHLQGLQEP